MSEGKVVEDDSLFGFRVVVVGNGSDLISSVQRFDPLFNYVTFIQAQDQSTKDAEGDLFWYVIGSLDDFASSQLGRQSIAVPSHYPSVVGVQGKEVVVFEGVNVDAISRWSRKLFNVVDYSGSVENLRYLKEMCGRKGFARLRTREIKTVLQLTALCELCVDSVEIADLVCSTLKDQGGKDKLTAARYESNKDSFLFDVTFDMPFDDHKKETEEMLLKTVCARLKTDRQFLQNVSSYAGSFHIKFSIPTPQMVIMGINLNMFWNGGASQLSAKMFRALLTTAGAVGGGVGGGFLGSTLGPGALFLEALGVGLWASSLARSSQPQLF